MNVIFFGGNIVAQSVQTRLPHSFPRCTHLAFSLSSSTHTLLVRSICYPASQRPPVFCFHRLFSLSSALPLHSVFLGFLTQEPSRGEGGRFCSGGARAGIRYRFDRLR